METVYGALLLHKAGKDINEENLKKVLEASGANVDESKVKSLVVSLKDVDIDKELESAVVASVAPATSGESSGDGEGSEDEAKAEPEEKKEAAAEGLSALFG